MSTSNDTCDKIARILIVDDHPLVRRGLRQLIDSEEDLEVCSEAPDAEEAIRLIASDNPDLVMVDISLPDTNGIELIKRIRTRNASIKLLVQSMHEESIYAERALRAGANGYVNKEVATDEVIGAIRHVLAGQVYLSSDMTGDLLQRAVGGDVNDKSGVGSLSDRELEVFNMIGKGMMTREIAEQLNLSIKTIETHREHIKVKLHLRNAAELTRAAVQWVLEHS